MDDSYVTFLVIGVALVLIDGQLIYQGGKGYLNKAYGEPESARSMNRLVTVLFHLVMLGLLALVSIITVDTGDPAKNVVVKTGIVLLLLAGAHASTIALIARLRDRQLQQQLADEMAEEHRIFEEQRQQIAEPRVSPAVETESREPHTTR